MCYRAYSVVLLTFCLCLLPVVASAQKGAVWTWHNDNLRDGQHAFGLG